MRDDAHFAARSRPERIDITGSTYYALRQLADLNGLSLNSTIFKLAHEARAKLQRKRPGALLPAPFTLDRELSFIGRVYVLGHPELDELALTRAELMDIKLLLDPRVAPPRIREFEARLTGKIVRVRRNRQGVRLALDHKKVNLSRIEAIALADALDHVDF